MADIAKMVQCWMHLDHHLQNVGGLACLFQVSDGNSLHVHVGVIKLGEQQTESPRVGLRAVPYEFTNMVRRV